MNEELATQRRLFSLLFKYSYIDRTNRYGTHKNKHKQKLVSRWLVVLLQTCMCVCSYMLSCVYVNLCNNVVKLKCPILRHVCISIKSHITNDSGTDKPVHTCRLRVVSVRWSALGLCVCLCLLSALGLCCVCLYVCVFANYKCLGFCPWHFLGFTQALFHKRRMHLIFLLARTSPIHCLVLTSTLQMSKWRGTAATCIRIYPYPLTAVTHVCVYCLGLEWFLPFSK